MLRYQEIRNLPGWLGFADFEIIRRLLHCQGSSGGILEIGVHHGKSTVAMASCSGSRRILAVDLFEDQHLNVDKSGRGALGKFIENLERFEISPGRVDIFEGPSETVEKGRVVDSIGPVSFAHIDGGHHLSAVLNDIELVCATGADDCIIAIDDVFRAEWPEVSIGLFESGSLKDAGFVMFCYGFNKMYLCREGFFDRYQAVVRQMGPLLKYKRVYLGSREVLVFHEAPLPEWGFLKLNWWQFCQNYPELAVHIVKPVEAVERFLRKRRS